MLVRRLASYLSLVIFLNIFGSLINTVVAGDQPPSYFDLFLSEIGTVKKGEYFFQSKHKLDYSALVEAIARVQQKPFTPAQTAIITKSLEPTSSRRGVMINKWSTGFQEALSPKDQALACIMLAAHYDTTNLSGDTKRKRTDFEQYVMEWAREKGLYKTDDTQRKQKSGCFSDAIEQYPISKWWVNAPEKMLATLANSNGLSEITFLADLGFFSTLKDKYQAHYDALQQSAADSSVSNGADTTVNLPDTSTTPDTNVGSGTSIEKSSPSKAEDLTVQLLNTSHTSNPNLKDFLVTLNTACQDKQDKKVVVQALFKTLTDYQKQLESKSSSDSDTDADDDPSQVTQLLNAVKKAIEASKDTMLPILASLYSNGQFLTYQRSTSPPSRQELQAKVTLLQVELEKTKEQAMSAVQEVANEKNKNDAYQKNAAKQFADLQSALDSVNEVRKCDDNNSFVMTIPDFENKVKLAGHINSHTYLADQNLLCRLRFYPRGDGQDAKKNKKISVFFQIVQYRMDVFHKENWPFESPVTFELLDGKCNGEVVKKETFSPDPASSSFMMPLQDRNNTPIGCSMFATQKQAIGALDERGCLHIRCTIEKKNSYEKVAQPPINSTPTAGKAGDSSTSKKGLLTRLRF